MIAVDPLVCPTCGKGPFMDRRALGGHRVAHETVVCDECGQTVNRRGLGPHRIGHKNRPGSPPPSPDVVAALSLLGRLATPNAAGRVRALLARLETFPAAGAFVVVGATYGPHLTVRPNVGTVVDNAREACVVLPLAAASALARLEAIGSAE